nr:hypothetical protein [Tanacetum cinerariifolium]
MNKAVKIEIILRIVLCLQDQDRKIESRSLRLRDFTISYLIELLLLNALLEIRLSRTVTYCVGKKALGFETNRRNIE